MDADIRWKQRFSNYKKALLRLNETALFFEKSQTNGDKVAVKVALEALIKCFEFTFELAWQTMKDFVSYKGVAKEIHGSRDSIRYALQFNIIENGQMWIDMIADRNRAAHAYDEDSATGLTKRIIEFYIEEFNKFETKMDGL
ncbi:MAG: nucleotidyltransferase substrate binding protein [Chitinivibrionia bacterium]|nr:nucleotidyltransferase substrate binding protein [Chitinivibrionia bacterium]